MNFKKNKGYVAVDASIAIIVLMIIIPTIAGMIYNVNTTNNFIDRKTEAISIAVNTIEAVKGIYITELNNEKIIDVVQGVYSNLDENELTLEKDNNTYKLDIEIQDYADTTEGKAKSAISGKVKVVKVIVTFKSDKQENNVELNTVIS